mmetsp:Transcript_42585/g.59669  ORF Transcript_42585/g.59669 Transcript_42585/m.59669 type:complete len:159 (-) Transcript_42585:64-540(-)
MSESVEKAFFSPSTKLPLVQGLVLVGNAERKRQLSQRLSEDLRLKEGFISVVTSDGSDDKSLEAARELICTKLCPQKTHKAEKEITELLETASDRLVFGRKELEGHLKLHLLQKVFVLKEEIDEELEELFESSPAEVICFTTSHHLQKLGGCVGVTWY